MSFNMTIDKARDLEEGLPVQLSSFQTETTATGPDKCRDGNTTSKVDYLTTTESKKVLQTNFDTSRRTTQTTVLRTTTTTTTTEAEHHSISQQKNTSVHQNVRASSSISPGVNSSPTPSFKSIASGAKIRSMTSFKLAATRRNRPSILGTSFPASVQTNTRLTSAFTKKSVTQKSNSKWAIVREKFNIKQTSTSLLEVVQLARAFQEAKQGIALKEESSQCQSDNLLSKKDKRKMAVMILGCMIEADFPLSFYEKIIESNQIKQIVKSFVGSTDDTKELLVKLCRETEDKLKMSEARKASEATCANKSHKEQQDNADEALQNPSSL